MHTILPPELPQTPPAPKPFQFGVRHLLAVMGTVCLAGAGYQWFGPAVLCLVIPLAIAALVMVVARGYVLQVAVVSIVVLGGIAILVLPNARTAPGAARRAGCAMSLKEIAIALHNYHETYKSFPPAYVADENGRPIHSWRVLILPFLEQKALYDNYRLDEPWDGPNNRQIAAELKIFMCGSDQRGIAGQTSYVAVVGPGTAWAGAKSVKFEEITDGISNTILLVEVHNSGIHWMEPRDLDASQMAMAINANPARKGVIPGISSGHPGVAQAAMADGSVRALPDDTPPATVRAMLTIAGGETVQRP
jgi:hypothetical protein